MFYFFDLRGQKATNNYDYQCTGDYEEREGQTDLAAPQQDQRSKIVGIIF